MTINGLLKRTKQRKEEDIVALSKLPIRALWEKSAIIKAGQNHIFDLYVKAVKGKNYKDIDKLESESAELAEKQNDISEAIRRK